MLSLPVKCKYPAYSRSTQALLPSTPPYSRASKALHTPYSSTSVTYLVNYRSSTASNFIKDATSSSSHQREKDFHSPWYSPPHPTQLPISKSRYTDSFVENNPDVFTTLAHKLGLSPSLEFVDIYSLTDDTLLSLVPRPVLGLLAIIPLTPAWHASRESEDSSKVEPYPGSKDSDEVLWFKQTIGHACGSIGLIHILLNGPAKRYILPDSTLAKMREKAGPFDMAARAQLLYDSKELEEAHQSVAELGDTIPPSAAEGDRLGQHFVGFVIENGKLWELEGGRKGALDRGAVEEGDDALSAKAVEAGLGRVIKMEEVSGGGDLRFSVIALVNKTPAGETEEGVIEGGIGGWQL